MPEVTSTTTINFSPELFDRQDIVQRSTKNQKLLSSSPDWFCIGWKHLIDSKTKAQNQNLRKELCWLWRAEENSDGDSRSNRLGTTQPFRERNSSRHRKTTRHRHNPSFVQSEKFPDSRCFDTALLEVKPAFVPLDVFEYWEPLRLLFDKPKAIAQLKLAVHKHKQPLRKTGWCRCRPSARHQSSSRFTWSEKPGNEGNFNWTIWSIHWLPS